MTKLVSCSTFFAKVEAHPPLVTVWMYNESKSICQSWRKQNKGKGKGKDILFNVGGQTGKDCLLTWADGVKVADRRDRTRNLSLRKRCTNYCTTGPHTKWLEGMDTGKELFQTDQAFPQCEMRLLIFPLSVVNVAQSRFSSDVFGFLSFCFFSAQMAKSIQSTFPTHQEGVMQMMVSIMGQWSLTS